MTNYIIRLVITGIIVLMVPRYLKGIGVDSFATAMIVALVMSLLNTFIRPVLSIISLPVTLMTLGLFSLVISVIIVYLCDFLVPGFSVSGFLPPLIFSIILSIANTLVGMFQEK